MSAPGPLEGLHVVEVSLGVTAVGAGLAASLPGALLRDLGAAVTKVRPARRPSLDAGVEYHRAWDREKDIVEVDTDDPDSVRVTISGRAAAADVLLLTGPEALLERAGLSIPELARVNPRLVGVRIRPSFNAVGPIPDFELLVAARAGLMTQIRAHEPGRPALPALQVGQAGAALSATVGALAGLYEREATGVGRWAETSIYDGLQALLPMILGRVEHHSPSTRLLWQGQGPAESLCYRCADGRYVQLWFGAKGAYEAFLEHMGEPPSEAGYNAELMSGAMVERGARWAARFATRDRDQWLADLAGHDFRCEPVLRPGEALLDDHVHQVGLAVDHEDPVLGPMTVLGPTLRVTPGAAARASASLAGGPLLSGVRVLDLSAYLAGPVTPLILAELGADVVKVEPLSGDVHRNMEPMFAAGQRSKRAVALNMKGPGATEVLARLFAWSDVVHHNSRVGLAERLGYDETTVRAANPGVVYSFASGFGEDGPRALLPANDQLMQALAGIEAAQAGAGRPPTFLAWGAVDVTGGWLAACGVLAGLYARRRTGHGQRVASSLLGAGLMLQSGAFVAGGGVVLGGPALGAGVVLGGPAVGAGSVVLGGPAVGAGSVVLGGPAVDSDQLGYGACYRIYQGSDGGWLALAVPDQAVWAALLGVIGGAGAAGLPAGPPPLRTDGGGPQPEEIVLASVFLSRPAAEWVERLRAAGVPVEPVAEPDRAGFTAGFVDDPVNLQLGRVVTWTWGERGRVDQPRFPPRMGPEPPPHPVRRPCPVRPGVPGLGAHTVEVLESIGFDAAARAGLAESGTIPVAPTF